MITFTVSLLSRSALTVIRDIIQIVVTKKAPEPSKSKDNLSGGEEDGVN
jgi:hypothetical protein